MTIGERKTTVQQLADMQKKRARLDAQIQNKASKIDEQADKERHRQLLRLGELLLDQCSADKAVQAVTLIELDQRLTRLVDRQLFTGWGLPVRLRGLCNAKPLPPPAPGWALKAELPPKKPKTLRERYAARQLEPYTCPFDEVFSDH